MNTIVASLLLATAVVVAAIARVKFPPRESELRAILNHDMYDRKVAIRRSDNMRYVMYCVTMALTVAFALIMAHSPF